LGAGTRRNGRKKKGEKDGGRNHRADLIEKWISKGWVMLTVSGTSHAFEKVFFLLGGENRTEGEFKE